MNGQEELVALDWALCGSGAIGNDFGELVAKGTFFLDSDPADVAELEATCFDGYLAGLCDAGLRESLLDPADEARHLIDRLNLQ